jgi:hypothetical protein
MKKDHTKQHPILDLPMQENDANAKTVRDYMKALLTQVITQKEGFSGKRPFGNSAWEYDMHEALFRSKLVEWDDDQTAEKMIIEAIKEM